MTALTFRRDGVSLRGVVTGDGAPLLYQHGLGGSEPQVAETVPDVPGLRRLTLESRGHGGSAPGERRPFSIGLFAEDALAFCDAEGVDRFIVGGTSMGAAIALRLAVRQPARIRGLVLARPAWLFDPAPDNMRPYAEVAAMMRAFPPDEARARFAASPSGLRLAREAPDNLTSLLDFCDTPDPAVLADLLGDIAADGPGVSRAEAAAVAVPTLVIGHTDDLVHPLSHAEDLAAVIPGAVLCRIPPERGRRPDHVAGFRAAVGSFLQRFAR